MTPSAILAHIASLPPTFTADQDWRLWSGLDRDVGIVELKRDLGKSAEEIGARFFALTRPLMVRGASGLYIPHEAQIALGGVLRGRLA